MIVVLKTQITKKEEAAVLTEIRKLGYKPHSFAAWSERHCAIGDERTHHTLEALSVWPQVEKFMPVQKRYKLVSREGQKENSISTPRRGRSRKEIPVMAGPCSVETEQQLMTTAEA